ncbi:MAG: hypothetical protein IPK53_07110 [bacterium]|nr:hypothetical protein [bacterium]
MANSMADGYIIESVDNGHWVCASGALDGSASQFLLFHISSEGDSVGFRSYGGTGLESVKQAVMSARGGAYLLGGTTSFGDFPNQRWSAWILRVNEESDSMWSVAISEPEKDLYAVSAEETATELVVLCWVLPLSPNSFERSLLIAKIDSSANVMWTRELANSLEEEHEFERRGYELHVSSDGSILITGSYDGFDNPDPEFLYPFWMRLTANGDSVTFVRLSQSMHIGPVPSFLADNDDTVVLAGRSGALIVSRVSLDGDLLWSRTYRVANNCWANTIVPTEEGRILLMGTAGYDIVFVEISSSGDSLTSGLWSGIGAEQFVIWCVSAMTSFLQHATRRRLTMAHPGQQVCGSRI